MIGQVGHFQILHVVLLWERDVIEIIPANSVYSLITMISTKNKDDVIGSFFYISNVWPIWFSNDSLVVLSEVSEYPHF